MHPGYLASSMQRLQKALTRTAMRLQDQTLFPPLHLRMTRVGDLEVPPRRLHPGPRRLVLDAMSLRSYGRGSGGGIIGRPRRDSDASAAFKKKSFALFNEQRQVFCFGDGYHPWQGGPFQLRPTHQLLPSAASFSTKHISNLRQYNRLIRDTSLRQCDAAFGRR